MDQPDQPNDGLRDSASPLRIMAPTEAAETPATLASEQFAAAGERAKGYPSALVDRLRERRIEPEQIDDARLRFTRLEDGLSQERIRGRSDLVPINWLEFGQRAGRPVCRIQIRVPTGAIAGHATGFLVAPGLLLTNNHVFPDAQMAMRSVAEFDYEDDIDFNTRPMRAFRLRPDELFFTSRLLDFSFVAVSPAANDGTPLASYGYLRLAADPDKLQRSEYVSIIQHPDGNTKQAALRENQVIWSDANFVHYETDTQPGSSGAPVFNDQWYVVALHHSAVARRDAAGNPLRRDGTPAAPGTAEDQIDWIANEGVRISRIFRALEESADTAAATALAKLRGTAGGADVSPIFVPAGVSRAGLPSGGLSILTPPQPSGPAAIDPGARVDPSAGSPLEALVVTPPASDAALYAGRVGYREDFLGDGARVALPRVAASEQLLRYANFSILFSVARRLARLTAVNVDGATWRAITRRRPDTWTYDPRLAPEQQAGRTLYDGTRYDFGHMVRRQDAASGAEAALGERDTFHLTNAAPQDHALNTGPWNDLENHVLDTIRMTRSRVTVLTGPVFRGNDPVDRGVQIPQDFFKIAAYLDDAGDLAAAGWVQRQPAGVLEVAPRFVGRYPMWQVPIARIGEITGLDFGTLAAADALASSRGREAEFVGLEARPIAGPDDMVL